MRSRGLPPIWFIVAVCAVQMSLAVSAWPWLRVAVTASAEPDVVGCRRAPALDLGRRFRCQRADAGARHERLASRRDGGGWRLPDRLAPVPVGRRAGAEGEVARPRPVGRAGAAAAARRHPPRRCHRRRAGACTQTTVTSIREEPLRVRSYWEGDRTLVLQVSRGLVAGERVRIEIDRLFDATGRPVAAPIRLEYQ